MYNISASELNDEKSNNFNILLDGYEGPIDLLLELAKKQKVDCPEFLFPVHGRICKSQRRDRRHKGRAVGFV